LSVAARLKAAAGKLASDPLLWLALGAGPAFWVALFFWTQPVFRLGWPASAPLAFVSVALIYPVLEEIVFRGLLQDWLAARFHHRAWRCLSVANVVASLIFSGLHFIYHPPLYAALVFFPSLVFGCFKDRHAGLAAPILLHVWYNSGYFWLFGAGL
jgi:membrane protease YdiL (CAAX protease family)